jgi:hypothetical protein
MRERRALTGFWWGNPLGIPRAGLEDSNEMDKGVEWIYLVQGTVKWMLQKQLREGMEWIDLTQDRVKWHVVVKTYVINLVVP